jgi:hypothetical protein
VTGIEVAHVGETEKRTNRPTKVDLLRHQQMSNVVAELQAIHDPPDEPGGSIVKDRHILRSDRPATARELVGLIAGFFAEQLRELLIGSSEQVDGEMRSCGRDRGSCSSAAIGRQGTGVD